MSSGSPHPGKRFRHDASMPPFPVVTIGVIPIPKQNLFLFLAPLSLLKLILQSHEEIMGNVKNIESLFLIGWSLVLLTLAVVLNM